MSRRTAEYEVLEAAKMWAATRASGAVMDEFSSRLFEKVNYLQNVTDTDPLHQRDSVLPSSSPSTKTS